MLLFKSSPLYLKDPDWYLNKFYERMQKCSMIVKVIALCMIVCLLNFN